MNDRVCHRNQNLFTRLVRPLSIVFLSLLLSSCGGQPRDLSSRYCHDELREDFWHLRELIFDNHPFTFTDRQELTLSFDLAEARLTDSMSIIEFLRVIAPAVSVVRCGHTRLSLPDGVLDDMYVNSRWLPFDIQVVRDTLVVMDVYSDITGVPMGSRIIAIDERFAADIIDSIKACLHADGSMDGYKYYRMNQNFKKLYALYVEEAEQYTVEYIPPDGAQVQTASVIGMTPSDIQQRMQQDPRDDRRGLVETDIREDSNYTILRVRFFDFYEDKSAMDTLDQFFQTLSRQDIGSLILDLRGNDGGDPYSSVHLLGFLMEQPFRYFSRRSSFMIGELKDTQKVHDSRFTGDLYVLVGGGCYSTTGHFLSILRGHGIGQFIGEETGGSHTCNGGYRERQLEHTGINLLLPHTRFIADAGNTIEDVGITPDVTVVPSVDDVVNGNDPVMDTAIALALDR